MAAALYRRFAAAGLVSLSLAAAAAAQVTGPITPIGGQIEIEPQTGDAFVVSFLPNPVPGPDFVIKTLVSGLPTPIAGLRLELGRVLNGEFRASTGEAVFAGLVNIATLPRDDPSFTSLSPDATVATLDLRAAFAASGASATATPAQGLPPLGAITLDFIVLSGLADPRADPGFAAAPLGVRGSLVGLPEPSAAVLLGVGLGAGLGLGRGRTRRSGHVE